MTKNSAISQTPPRREVQRDAGELVGDVGIALTRRQDRMGGGVRAHAPLPVRRVVPAREVGGARPRAELFEQARSAGRSRRRFATAESLSFRSPNTIALVGQACWQAVTTSSRAQRRGFPCRPATCAASMRCVQ